MSERSQYTRRKQRNKQIATKSISLLVLFIGLIAGVKLLNSDSDPVSAADNINVETQPIETEMPVVVEEKHVTEVPFTSVKEESNAQAQEEEDVSNDSYVTELLISSGPGYSRLIDTMNDEVIQYTNEIGPEYGIDPCLLQAIIFYESSNRQDVSNGTCVGLMQVSTKWHTERAKSLDVDLYDSYGNVLTGTDYLSELYDEYENITAALMVYHGESDALIKAENGQTSSYVNNIMNLYFKLKDLEVGYENQ